MEDILKAAITLMIRGKIYEGKTVFLNMLQYTVNLVYDHRKYDSYEGKNNRCLCLFTHIWKIAVKQRCTSVHCPMNNKEVNEYLSTFSFSSCRENLNEVFPKPETQVRSMVLKGVQVMLTISLQCNSLSQIHSSVYFRLKIL